MRKLPITLAIFVLLLTTHKLFAQHIRFNQVLKNTGGFIADIKQDKQGVLWMANLKLGLQRYDGVTLTSFTNNQPTANGVSSTKLYCIAVDNHNMIWGSTLSDGLQKFDPATHTFTRFRHNPADAGSISSDTVIAVLADHLGNLWVGTSAGLDLLDRKTGKFAHYKNVPHDLTSLSQNGVTAIFEDKKGVLWIGCSGSKVAKAGESGLNRFDRATHTFTRYPYNPANPKSLQDSRVAKISEDGQGRLWILTQPPQKLYLMDRDSGTFTRYYPDPTHSGSLSQHPVAEKLTSQMYFITNDVTGALWVSLGLSGLNRYDAGNKSSIHFGSIYDQQMNKLSSVKDSTYGFNSAVPLTALSTKDGLFWVGADAGNLYNLNYNKTTIPFYPTQQPGVNSFYANNTILWLATDGGGLVRRDLRLQKEKVWVNEPKNNNSLSNNIVNAIRVDEEGKFWLATNGGLDKFDPVTEKFIHYRHNPKNPNSSVDVRNRLTGLLIDHEKNIWVVAGDGGGISRMDRRTGLFTHYKHNEKDSSSMAGDYAIWIAEDSEYHQWVASNKGMSRLNVKTGKFRNYIPGKDIRSICIDSKGVVWAGGEDGLYYYDKAKDKFILFANGQSLVSVSNVINLLEDNQQNLWVSTNNAIIKINKERTKLKKYGSANGVHSTSFVWNDNHKAKDGKLYLGIENGYYAFYPHQLSDSTIAPQLSLTAFKLGDKVITPEPAGILTTPLWQATEIRLNYLQNVFSFEFFAVDYISPGDEKYLFMLENYDNTWHNIGSDHRAFFFNVPPGHYNFRVKVVNDEGITVEKSIRIVISPPWYKTWWAYLIYGLLIGLAGYLIYKYQKYYILSKERQRSQQKELAQAKEIEKAYAELKQTQAQLIQKEKLASLGELTAGIAHEIQNPLNFVNNFSELSVELISELKEERNKEHGKRDEELENELLDDLAQNQEKINLHGKRASSIVKGMLEHSRTGTGESQLTDINQLADEYLRLSYHGMKAKDKTDSAHRFEADYELISDPNLPLISIVPQEIGRVLLNLLNNAFYAVNAPGVTNPKVIVSTSHTDKQVIIKVQDNGTGIPDAIKAKIFQPFFTTKPTGEGTGLGLSLAYDIVTKGHGGTLSIESTEGEGSTFIIHLPTLTH